MVDYCSADLKRIQQYRAVCEKIPCSKHDTLVNETAIRLPQPVLEQVIVKLDPTTNEECVTEEAQGVDIDVREAAEEAIEEFEQEQQTVARERLRRINSQEKISPFKTVTETEVAFGFSAETLTNARLVNAGGVGTALSALSGMVQEMGMDPEEVIPDTMLEGPVATTEGEPLGPSGLQTLSDYFEHGAISDEEADSDRIVDERSRVSRHELMQQHNPVKDSLRHQLKYVRDCYFLRELYNPFTSLFDTLDCPQIVWKQAAVDVQNDEDPFSISTGSDSDRKSVPTEKLFDQAHLPEHLKTDSGSASEDPNTGPQNNKQTGLGQFG